MILIGILILMLIRKIIYIIREPMKYEAAISNFENIIRHWQEHRFGVWSIAEKKIQNM